MFSQQYTLCMHKQSKLNWEKKVDANSAAVDRKCLAGLLLYNPTHKGPDIILE